MPNFNAETEEALKELGLAVARIAWQLKNRSTGTTVASGLELAPCLSVEEASYCLRPPPPPPGPRRLLVRIELLPDPTGPVRPPNP
ncbi:MAG: hypothetical protein WB493_01270 [Anaeromyxobacteraceae bacterium]